jgi:hypothetical protein
MYCSGYEAALNELPAPGKGCHPHLLTIANIGFGTGRDRDQIFNDTRQAIPDGQRDVPDREIWDAIEKAENEVLPFERSKTNKATMRKSYHPPDHPRIDANSLRDVIMGSGSNNEADLIGSSPTQLNDNPKNDTILLLKSLYRSNDYLFLGDIYDKEVTSRKQWEKFIKNSGSEKLPHIIPNVLTGCEHKLSNDKLSKRCDAAVKQFRFALVEFDNMSRSDQLLFWSGWIQTPKLPKVACLIDSGNKSIHAWIEVNHPDREAWDREVKENLFEKYLIPLGVDRATRNPSRLSRLPGHKRGDKWQRLLYLK